jgi:hypothetical protein
MAETWEQYFQPGETLLWEGAPKPGVHGYAKIISMALFGLPFLVMGGGLCIFGLYMFLGDDAWEGMGLGLFMTLFSLPFVGVGAFLVFGQWIAAKEAHRRVRYAVSSRCAYVAQSWRKHTLDSYPILPGTSITLEKGRNADTVWFHAHVEKDSDGDRTTTRIGFENIADGDRVYHLLRSIQTGIA